MKQFFTLIVLLGFGLLNGQISINPGTLESTISQEGKEIFNLDITNTTTNNYEVFWKLVKVDFPSEWKTQVCDGNLCYGYNFDECPSTKPNLVGPNATSTGVWSVKVDPRGVKGSGKIYFELYADADFKTLIGTTSKDAMFTADNLLSNTNINLDNLKLYPNPAVHYFSVKDDQAVVAVSLVNVIGKEIWSKRHTKGTTYDVSDLNKGIYLVRLMGANGKLLKTIRLNKTVL